MAKPDFIQNIKKYLLASRRHWRSGFTLTELLVSMIIGAFLVALLLGFVVEVTQNNQQDAARSQVQQDMQAAMDYITQDLREAVFVYNGQCLQGNGTPTNTQDLKTICPGIVPHLPQVMRDNPEMVPVLAFWRTERLPTGIQKLCSDNAQTLDDTDNSNNPTNPLVLAGVPCISGNSYALVVYALDTTERDTWQGNARIRRYKLSQFANDATDVTQTVPGYLNPLNGPDSTFQQWPYGTRADKTFGDLRTSQPVNVAPPVLVDFVDDRGAVDDNNNALPIDCTEFAPTIVGTTNKDPIDIANALSPKDAPNTTLSYGNRNLLPMRGFYACVRNGGIGNAAPKAGENQDVLLSLMGNVLGQSGFSRVGPNGEALDSRAKLTPIQTRVLVRGVVNKVNPTS